MESVSVELLCLVINHLTERHGDRNAEHPAIVEFADHLGQAEQAFLRLPKI